MDRVRVLCRVRPTTAEEQTRGERVVAIQGAQRLRLQNAAEYVGEHEASWAFDAAYDTDASQAQVYESIQPITQDVLRGFHATVFAYGQTGAGKTHSMFGPPDCSLDGPDAGVVPRLLKDLFAGLTAGDEVRVSCLELYDDLRDLLNEEHRPLKLRENRKDGSVVVDGAVDAVVKDVPATLALLERALVRRVVASHEMNADSSRSHFVASFRVTRPSINASAIMRLVDLAGSERVAKTKATGGTLNEAKRINSSLSALGNVIAALTSSTATHVPYRDSKLTRLLQSSLGGNAKTALLVCVSASSLHAEETVSTLRFGVRAKRVRNAAKVNVDVDDDLLAARLELAALRAERDDAVRERDAAQLQAADKEALLVSERSETTQLRDKIGSLERAEAARKAAEALRAMEDSVRAAAAPPPPDLDAIYDAHAADLASSLASLRLNLQAESRKEAERAALSARNELTSVKEQHAVAQKRHEASVASLKADIARHASDLDALTSDRDRLTDQLSQRDAKIASLRSARAREVEATKGEAAAERAALAQEHEAAVAELRRTQAQALEAARKDAAQELEAARTEAAGALVALNTEAEAQRAAASKLEAELRDLREAHASEASDAAAAWEKDLAALREKHAQELESLRSAAADAEALRDAHKSELSKLREAHEAELTKAGQAATEAATAHADELAAATKAAAATARQDAKAAEEALMEGHARELEVLRKEHAKATDAMQREHDAAMDDKQRRYDAELEALGNNEDAVEKAVAEALEAKARERATKEKELDQSLQWARETHARELANARKEMAEAVAAKDAEVRAAQDAHTRLLDAEAKRRADVQKAVEEKEMKLARDHSKKLSRLADDHAKALERRDQEHRAERKQDLVKADESAVKFSEALQAKEREHASLVASLEEKQLKALEEKDERCKEETDAAMEAVEAAQLRANEAEAAARAHEVAAAGLARQLAAAEGRADDLNKGLDALSTEHDTVTKAVVGSRLEGAEAAYEKLRLQVELKRLKKELVTAKDDAENARRELREERARPGLLARLKNVVSRERPADIALYPTNTA